jgi:threonine dehydrogenase-like Zn-dependent dehydrogenase
MGSLTAGARVLIIGTGPIGLATAFWARRLGAVAVGVTATSTQRAGLALELGATHFFEPSAAQSADHEPPNARSWWRPIRETVRAGGRERLSAIGQNKLLCTFC